jgi:hypothetical protein
MKSFSEHPLLYTIMAIFGQTKESKVTWTDNDIRLFSPETPPCNEYFPKKRSGNVSPPILKYSTKPS